MKLSEAIREGAKLRPQMRGAFFARGCSCAMGAAYEAVTGSDEYDNKDEINETLDEAFKIHTLTLEVPCPADDGSMLCVARCEDTTISSYLVHLNDEHHWSREQIADWLEGQGL